MRWREGGNKVRGEEGTGGGGGGGGGGGSDMNIHNRCNRPHLSRCACTLTLNNHLLHLERMIKAQLEKKLHRRCSCLAH